MALNARAGGYVKLPQAEMRDTSRTHSGYPCEGELVVDIRRWFRGVVLAAFMFPLFSYAFSPSCALGLKTCVKIQGSAIPLEDAERILDECSDFTRGNIGARALRMSFAEIERVSGGNLSHPLIRASFAYDYLHDSSLRFDRSSPIEQRYLPLRRACGEAYRDMGIAFP